MRNTSCLLLLAVLIVIKGNGQHVKPGAPVVFDDKANAFPVKLSDIERGEYYVQAVWERNLAGLLPRAIESLNHIS